MTLAKVWLREKARYEAIDVLGYPESIYYEMVLRESNEIIGRVDLRLADTEHVYYEGHVGYYVKPEYRGNRYTIDAIQELIPLAKSYRLSELTFACSPDNMASIKVIQRLGAKFIECVPIPKGNERYLMGDTETNRYSLNI